MSRHVIRALFAALGVAFFAVPIALRAVGVTPEAFENRKLADPPKLSQGWDAFQQTSAFVIDHMPLRAQAVRANTRIWTDVFGTDPPYERNSSLASNRALPFSGNIGNARRAQGGTGLQGPATVRTGRAGWDYLSAEFQYACDDTISDKLVLKRWGRLLRAIRSDGHLTVLLAVPEKASVYPEYLPEKYPFDHCALSAKERFWRLLSRDGPSLGVRELRSPLRRLKADAGDDLFQRNDLHWTTLGAVALVDAALDAIGNGVELESSEVVARGSVSFNGDLGLVSSRSAKDTYVEYDIVRASDAPRVPGRTLLVGDSFAYEWIRLFRPYFENIRAVSLYKEERTIADAIVRSDIVILEAEEINLKAHAADKESVLSIIRELRSAKP